MGTRRPQAQDCLALVPVFPLPSLQVPWHGSYNRGCFNASFSQEAKEISIKIPKEMLNVDAYFFKVNVRGPLRSAEMPVSV